jgi:hypothetical protein
MGVVSRVDRRLRFCSHCQQNVRPTKKFSVGWFLLLLFLTFGVGGFIYLLYYAAKTPQDCPICGVTVYRSPPRLAPSAPPERPLPVSPGVAAAQRFCTACGAPIGDPVSEFCGYCGASLS